MIGTEGQRVVAVIPVFNEASTVRDVVLRTLAIIDKVIVIDDGSNDETRNQLKDLPIELLCNSDNIGKSRSLIRGMQRAVALGYSAVITLDGDNQHLPEDIPKFLDMAQKFPHHIIIGARLANRSKFPPSRYYANRVANFWISWAAHHVIADSQSGFRLYPVGVITKLAPQLMCKGSFVFESEILIEAGRVGIYTKALPIAAIYLPHARPSHFHPLWDLLRIARMIALKLLKRGLDPIGFYRMLRSGRAYPARIKIED